MSLETKPQTEAEKQKTVSENKSKKVAVILVRGMIGVNAQQRDTFKSLNLHRKNFCVLLKDSPSVRGMINKVKDFITWGEPNKEMIKKLESFGSKVGLHPPRGGFERKGIKIPFKVGGALGNRKEKITDLLMRMMP